MLCALHTIITLVSGNFLLFHRVIYFFQNYVRPGHFKEILMLEIKIFTYENFIFKDQDTKSTQDGVVFFPLIFSITPENKTRGLESQTLSRYVR